MKPRTFIRGLVVMVLVVLLFLLIVTGRLGQPLVILFTGWFAFLGRVLPQVTINWSGLVMVLVCSLLVVFGMQWLCQWFYSHWVRQGPADAEVRWRWTWTASLYGAVWLLFLAAMGATGVVHQLGWLASNREPLYVERGSGNLWRAYLRMAHMSLYMAADDAKWNPVDTRQAFESSSADGRRVPRAPEELHVIYLESPSNMLAAAILFYRDPKKQNAAGFLLATPDNDREEFKMDQLQTVLARYRR